MTSELHSAMARYEAARGSYRVAVLRSFGTPSGGKAIRAAIAECQAALSAVVRLGAPRPELRLRSAVEVLP